MPFDPYDLFQYEPQQQPAQKKDLLVRQAEEILRGFPECTTLGRHLSNFMQDKSPENREFLSDALDNAYIYGSKTQEAKYKTFKEMVELHRNNFERDRSEKYRMKFKIAIQAANQIIKQENELARHKNLMMHANDLVFLSLTPRDASTEKVAELTQSEPTISKKRRR
jgi:hypothetical protein